MHLQVWRGVLQMTLTITVDDLIVIAKYAAVFFVGFVCGAAALVTKFVPRF